MKEEELLLLKGELARIKECRNAYAIVCVVVVIYGLFLSFPLLYTGYLAAAVGILVFFIIAGIIFFVMCYNEAREYRDKLNELKKSEKVNK